MFFLAAAAQMRELDRRAIEERGVPSLELMENAARAVADAVSELLPPPDQNGPVLSRTSYTIIGGAHSGEHSQELEKLRAIIASKNADPTPRVAVFCGPGNNGGDGVAAARLLREDGYRVRAFLVGDRAKMTSDQRAMEENLVAAGGELEDFLPRDMLQRAWLSTCDCMVDALFGIGLKRPVEGDFYLAVQWMSHGNCPVVSCDIPSGVDADTGAVLGAAAEAQVTVTFTFPKPGLYLGEGGPRAGEVRVVPIGIPHDLEYEVVGRTPEPVETVNWEECILPRRPIIAHKGDFGKVFVLAGSVGYTGAPVLAAEAALRAGAGLVYLGVPKEVYPIIAARCAPEVILLPLPDTYEEILNRVLFCDVALIGPGLGRAPETETLVLRLLSDLEIPVVLDADGINALAGHIDRLDKRHAPTVLTPHEGEFGRLTGCDVPVRDRLGAARDFAKAHRCALVLKGHGTVTAAPDGRAWINTTGNPGMAKGGSGDVLSGIIAALWGQKHLNGQRPDPARTTLSLSHLAAWGVCLHGAAGDLCAKELGEYGMTPGDLVQALPLVLRQEQ